MVEERRRRDRFLDLNMDDRLWANMIRSHYDLLAMNKEELNDPVIY